MYEYTAGGHVLLPPKITLDPNRSQTGLPKIRLHHFSHPESTHRVLERSCKQKMTKNDWISDDLSTGKCFHDALHQTIKMSPRASSYQQVPP